MSRLKLIIESSPLSEERMSGIGHAILEIIRTLEKHPDCGKKFDIYLAIAFDKRGQLDRWQFKKVYYKNIPCPMRLLNIIWKFNLLPPMDLLLGRGTYIFPNYKNWWVPFSKSVTYIHDIGFVLYPQYVAPKNQQFLEKRMPKWIKRSTIIATDSNSAKREIIAHYPEAINKTAVLHHGVDTKEFYPRPHSEIEIMKKKYAITGEYILYLGNIEPRKNLEKLVEAYGKLPNELKDKYSLLLVGGLGWLNQPIYAAIERSQKAGNKIIRPTKFWQDQDLPALYSGATILSHPAIYEGFGLPLVQAMACGTPVAAGNNSSMIEVVGKAGLLMDVNDVNDISGTIERLLRDPNLRQTLSLKGIEQVKKYSWENTVTKLLNLVEHMN